jgi:putative salt-induced outer membrane protein YdiY
VGPGLGYQIWDEDRIALGLEAGISYFIQDHEIAEDDQYATGRGAINFKYKITDTILFDDHLIVYPSFESFGDYTLRNEASLSTEIGSGWKLRLSNILENDNTPPAGIEETDVKWILALGYAF